MNLENYNIPNSDEIELEYEPIKEAWYPVQIEKEETKQTSKGGLMLVYTLQIFGDSYKGRKVFTQFNIVCPGSEEAEKIGRKQLGILGSKCHLENIKDSSELLGKTCKAHVIKEEYNGKIYNKVDKFDYLDTATTTATPKNDADTPFWMK